MIQLRPSIPVITPKGKAKAIFLIDYSEEHDIMWVCFLDDNGECWTFNNRDIRAQKNITLGRECISPCCDPSDVAFRIKEEDG